MVKTFSSSAGAVGSVPGQGIKNAALRGWDKKIKKKRTLIPTCIVRFLLTFMMTVNMRFLVK